MTTCPELSKLFGVCENLLRYHLRTDSNAPKYKIKRGKTGSDTKDYNLKDTTVWWENKQAMKAKRAPSRKKPKPNYTMLDVASWIAYQREHKLTLNKLAKHLRMGFDTVKNYIEKYDAGQLK